jgi:hypothetical protein
MTQRPAVLLLYPAALAGLAALLYAPNWRRDSTTMLQEIRATLKQNGNKAHETWQLLNKQRHTINEIRDHLPPVTKGSTKASS